MTACNGGEPGRRDDNTLVRIAEDEVKSLDPQAVSDLASLRVAADQFEGLTRFGAAGEAEPALANAWTVSPDGLEWVFTMETNARFSDSTQITPQMFTQVLARLRAPETASPTKAMFDGIDTVTADGPNRVRVRLLRPYPALAELLAQPAMAALPLHRPGWTKERPMVTSGAYRVTSWALNDRVDMDRNPQWQGPTRAFLRVSWQPVSDGLTALRKLEAGTAEIVGEIPAARLEDVRARHGKRLRIAPYRGTYYFTFNTKRPPFDDWRVRTALSMAVERNWIADKLLATGVLPAWGLVPPGMTGLAAYRPDWAGLSRDARLARAAALLKQAGYGPERPLRFEVRFNSDTDHRRVAVAMAAMWRPLGVEAAMLNSEASLHFASLRRRDFTLARSGWIGDLSVPENFLGVHHSDAGPVNYSGHADPRFDALLDTALNEPDPARRAAAMRAAEVRFISNAAVIPLYYYVSKSLLSARITGWRDNPANIHPSRTIGHQ